MPDEVLPFSERIVKAAESRGAIAKNKPMTRLLGHAWGMKRSACSRMAVAASRGPRQSHWQRITDGPFLLPARWAYWDHDRNPCNPEARHPLADTECHVRVPHRDRKPGHAHVLLLGRPGGDHGRERVRGRGRCHRRRRRDVAASRCLRQVAVHDLRGAVQNGIDGP